VGRWIVAVDSTAEDCHRRARGLERAAVRLRVDAAREPADDDEPHRREVATEATRDLTAVRGAGACADDRDRRSVEQVDLGLAAHEETGRRIVDRAEQRREGAIRPRDEAEAERRQARELRPRVEPRLECREACAARLAHEVRVVRRGERRQCQLVHAASSFGER
jgi:hypothetical protein